MTRRQILPGYRLTLGLTIFAITAMVVIPLAGLAAKSASLSGAEFWEAVTSPRALAALELTFVASLTAAAVITPFGLLVAWVLVRYRFPGRAVVDAIVDVPFALPTAIAGLTLTALYGKEGWLGKPLAALGIDVAYTRLGIMLALAFVGLPFVVRAVQPVLEAVSTDVEEAAAVLGATKLETFTKITLPTLVPGLLTGFAMAFARGVGEYGSVVFIAGNVPMRTEITPLLIVTKLEQYDYAGAAALAVVSLGISLALLFIVSALQRRTSARLHGKAA